jgi:hypothetical protein
VVVAEAGECGRPPVLIGGAAGPKLSHTSPSTPTAGYRSGAPASRTLPELQRACGRDAARRRCGSCLRRSSVPGKVDAASLGITELVLRVPSGDRDQVLPRLDRYAELVGS